MDASKLQSQEHTFWLERWEEGETDWHQDTVDKALQVVELHTWTVHVVDTQASAR